ncbi:Uncharacterised protein [uncultured Eubacterium sp.]|nr:Uncharacterised protein [uncultured Eubacterium sp.]
MINYIYWGIMILCLVFSSFRINQAKKFHRTCPECNDEKYAKERWRMGIYVMAIMVCAMIYTVGWFYVGRSIVPAILCISLFTILIDRAYLRLQSI